MISFKKNFIKKISIAFLLLALLILAWWSFFVINQPKSAVSAITREGVVTEIQQLSRLTSVAFSIDTVITAQKQGNWYKLWQDEQKGLFVAHGRVLAGVDLAKIQPDMVEVQHTPAPDKKTPPTTHISITLPSSEIFEVYLDDIQVYDWQTGLFGMVNNDPEILNQAQVQGKQEVLKKACAGNIMQMAQDNASEQVSGLFRLTGAQVTIKHETTKSCT